MLSLWANTPSHNSRILKLKYIMQWLWTLFFVLSLLPFLWQCAIFVSPGNAFRGYGYTKLAWNGLKDEQYFYIKKIIQFSSHSQYLSTHRNLGERHLPLSQILDKVSRILPKVKLFWSFDPNLSKIKTFVLLPQFFSLATALKL